MGLPLQQEVILFALGKWYEECDLRLKDRSLRIVLSKKKFIDAVRKVGIARKSERAVYKNLENLEKRRLIVYVKGSLSLSKSGSKRFSVLSRRISPFLQVKEILGAINVLKSSAVQTQLR